MVRYYAEYDVAPGKQQLLCFTVNSLGFEKATVYGVHLVVVVK